MKTLYWFKGGQEGLGVLSFAKKGNVGYKMGQELLIYYDGMILTTFPVQFGDVGKIKILKDKSDIEISKNSLRYAYSSIDNISIIIDEFTKSDISFYIIDVNEIPYDYHFYDYRIYKEVKNENYTGIGYRIGEDSTNSTAGFTRNRIRIYLGRSTKIKYWERKYYRTINI